MNTDKNYGGWYVSYFRRIAFRVCVAVCIIVSITACTPSEEDHRLTYHTFRVINTYPHDPNAFTQGLQFHNGYLYESTGFHGRSTLRRVELETGQVVRLINLPAKYFGEGIAIVEDRIYMLTWREQTGFVFDRATFEVVKQFSYEGEGWGLAYDGTHLIMSDGTARLRFLDPVTCEVVKIVEVQEEDQPIRRLNELVWINGELWANVFPTYRIVRINPVTGQVRGWIDLRGILTPALQQGRRVDVMNGIAYDAENDRIFVTGKLWPVLFEIELVERSATAPL